MASQAAAFPSRVGGCERLTIVLLAVATLVAVQAAPAQLPRLALGHRAPATVRLDGGDLHAQFSPRGASIAPVDNRWTLKLGLAAAGRQAAALPVTAAAPARHAGRVVYQRRPGLAEWWKTAPTGIEQGFDLTRRPAGAGPVVLRLGVSGDLLPVADPAGVTFLTTKGEHAFRYDSLRATDARARELPSTMQMVGGAIELHVDDAGAAYPIVVDPMVILRQATLTQSGTEGFNNEQAGSSVAVSGDTTVIGAPHAGTDNLVDAGAAYVYVRANGVWTYQATLKEPTVTASELFGSSVAISGDTVVVGAPSQFGGANPGSAHVFVRSGTTWSYQAALAEPSPRGGDLFGTAVAVSGASALVGAPFYSPSPSAVNGGAAFVYTRSGTSWPGTEATLVHPTEAGSDRFGTSVALDGNTAIVGAPTHDVGGVSNAGSAEVFLRTFVAFAPEWSSQGELVHPQPGDDDEFGKSVAVSGDTAVAGAWLDDTAAGGTSAGSAQVFTRAAGVWSWQAGLEEPGATPRDHFGESVGVAADTVVVGAPEEFTGDPSDQGSAHVFVRTGTPPAWTLQASFPQKAGATDQNYGFSVALSGDTAVIGVPLDDTPRNTDEGSARPFFRTGTAWANQGTLVAPSFDQFGTSVAISGDTAVVGIPGQDSTSVGADVGSAQVFVRTGSTWAFQATLAPPSNTAGDKFGTAVAIWGDTIVVGAPTADVPETGAGVDSGAADVFVRSGSSWSLQARLEFLDNDIAGGDLFGQSVAISGDTVVVGAPTDDTAAGADAGSARVFTRAAGAWQRQAELFHPSGAGGDSFGFSVAVDGNTALVGAWGDTTAAGNVAGSAQVFVRSGSPATWTIQQQLLHPDPRAGDSFGFAVALSGNTALIGSHRDDTARGGDAGSAHVFVRSGTTWTFQATLTDPTGSPSDWFGWSVAISGNTAVIGAMLDDTAAGANAGTAHVFTRSGTTWTQTAVLADTVPGVGDQFGFASAASPDTLLVGANVDDNARGADAGSVSVFRLPGVSGAPNPVTRGTALNVTWSGISAPTAQNRVGLFADSAATTPVAQRNLNGAALGTLPLTVPSTATPGSTYELRLFADSTDTVLATSTPLTVTATTVSGAPNPITVGNALNVTWSNIATPSTSDWVGLYQNSTTNSTVTRRNLNGAAAGTLPLTVPSTAGPGSAYELRVWSNNVMVARSTPLTVTATAVSGAPNPVTVGKTLNVTWSNIASPTSTDYVGLFASPSATSAVSSRYLTGAASGTVPLTVPSTATPGTTYELRVFAHGSTIRLATSNPLTVTATSVSGSPNPVAHGSTLNVTWANIASPTSTDYVGLFASPDATSAVVAHFTTGAASGAIPLTVPAGAAPGTTYELRLFTHGTTTRIAISAPITVT